MAFFVVFLEMILFIYLFVAVLGPHCLGFSLAAENWGYSLVAVRGLLTMAGFSGAQAGWLWCTSLVAL